VAIAGTPIKRRFPHQRKPEVLPIVERFFFSGPSYFEATDLAIEEGQVPKHYTRPLLRVIRWQEAYHRCFAEPDSWCYERQLRRAEQLLMTKRWEEDGAKRLELDAARMKLYRIRDVTRGLHERVQIRLVIAVLDRHPCLVNVMVEARCIVEREQQEHQRRADRIATEMEWGSQLRPEEKLRKNVHKWRERGLLDDTHSEKSRENEGEWRSWAAIRGTPEQ
jgi:hypothetical protein